MQGPPSQPRLPLLASLEQQAQRLRDNPAAMRAMLDHFQGGSGPQRHPAQNGAAEPAQAGSSIHDHAREASFSDWACVPGDLHCAGALLHGKHCA